MTSRSARRLALSLLSAVLMATAFVLVPSSPASAVVTQGISGHVTGSNGAPLAGIEVAFYLDVTDGEGAFIYWTSTATNALGNYAMQLDPGSYRVAFKDSASGDYVTEFWNNSPTYDAATAVAVTSSHVTANVNGQLARGGHIQGHVTGGTGGKVRAWTESSPGAGDWEPRIEVGDVGPAGDFDIGGLPTGTYRVEFRVDDFAPEFWEDKADVDSATPISVTAPNTITGINPTLTPNGHITGHVQDSDGAATPDVVVDAYILQDGEWIASDDLWTFTDQSGAYNLSAPPGTYRLQFFPTDGEYASEFYDDAQSVDAATSVAVSSGHTVPAIDASLVANGHITGHLENAEGAPIQGATVDAYTFDGTDWVYADFWGGVTDENGGYQISAAPGTYRLKFAADHYASEYYDDKPTVENADDVIVTSGATASGTDAVLDVGASISGTVTLPAGADLDSDDSDIDVVDPTTGNTIASTWFDSADETAPGSNAYTYTVDGLPAGSYRVEFAHEEGWATVEAEFYNDHAESAGPGSADAVTLTAGQQKTGVDATLRAGGTISGTLVDGNGAPIADCEVVAFNNVDDFVGRVGTTDTDGTFVIGGLTTGEYGLLVGGYGPCATIEYYTNANGDLSESGTGIIPVSAEPGTDTPITADLVYGGSVAEPSISNTAAPTVPASAPVVGTPVTVDPGAWDPADATLSYQWKANNADIPGATGSSYTPVAADVGKQLSVAVTAKKSGYQDATVTSNSTAPVTGASQGAAIANTAAPGITGIPRVGLDLSAYAGSWYTQSGAPTTTVQWLRNGVPILGATGTTYVLGADDLGARISLRVTATKDGYPPSQQTSAATEPVVAGILTLTDAPRLLGRLKVGKVLTAVAPTSTPAAAGVRYQWLRNGVPIKGLRAKQARYSLVRADRGKHISVRITVLRPGYAPTASVAKKAGRVR